jgi:hypothetical protein
LTSQSTPDSIAPANTAADAGADTATNAEGDPAPPPSTRPPGSGPWAASPSDGRLPLLCGGRPLKRWRYVGVFCEELMACAALVQVGPARQSFWAVYLHTEGELYERTRLLPRRRELSLEAGRLLLRDRRVRLDLSLTEDTGWQARCGHGDGPAGGQRGRAGRLGPGEVWTRKQAGGRAHGSLALDGGPPRAIEALAVIDDTAGYHARHTEWWWTAGVGRDPDGRALAWNLVSGVNDPPEGSERAVWIDGAPQEAPPVEFSPTLRHVRAIDGAELRFHPEAERAHRQNLVLVKSDYRAPFGSFSGTLPGGLALAHGLGVVEHHRALW